MARKKISFRFPNSPQAICDAALFVQSCKRTGGQLSIKRKGRWQDKIVCLLPKGVKQMTPIPEWLPTLSDSVESRARNISPVPRLFP